MEYIKLESYDYIMNKYHQQDQPFDPHRRFIRNDGIFSADSGMDPELLMAGILENDALYAHRSHPIRKARALEYILKNTRIACDRRDIFPAINMVDRPLRTTLIEPWKKEVFTDKIPEVGQKRSQLERDGIVIMWLDYDHSVPVWGRVFALGFSGLLRESEKARAGRTLSA